jgi:universal stress protein A
MTTKNAAKLNVHVRPGAPSDGASASSADIHLVPAVLNLKKILVPTDFSEFADKGLRYALRFAEQFGASLTLLHVVEPRLYPEGFLVIPPEMEQANADMLRLTQEKLEAFRQEIGPAIQTAAHVRMGSPYAEIVAAAQELEIDLIILPTHGYTGLKHILIGSTAERVVRHAPCPVLTVRADEREFA